MAKRGRQASVDKLLAKLRDLDNQRRAVMEGIKAAVAHVLEADAPVARKTKRRTPTLAQDGIQTSGSVVYEVRKRAPMSAAARAKIAAAQRKRWAKQKKAAKGLNN